MPILPNLWALSVAGSVLLTLLTDFLNMQVEVGHQRRPVDYLDLINHYSAVFDPGVKSPRAHAANINLFVNHSK